MHRYRFSLPDVHARCRAALPDQNELCGGYVSMSRTRVVPADPSIAPARQLGWEVVGSYPHDPGAFLQGLVWHDGGFFEARGSSASRPSVAWSGRAAAWSAGSICRRTSSGRGLPASGTA